MFKKLLDIFLVFIRKFLDYPVGRVFMPLLNIRDVFFVLLIKHIKFRKDVAELLCYFIELKKRDDVMIRTEDYGYCQTSKKASPKRV